MRGGRGGGRSRGGRSRGGRGGGRFKEKIFREKAKCGKTCKGGNWGTNGSILRSRSGKLGLREIIL